MREIRTIGINDARIVLDDSVKKLTGYAVVYNAISHPIADTFRERIRPGAFTKSLKTADLRALIGHNDTMLLGRQKSGTLTVTDEEYGLQVSVTPPDTSYAKDLIEVMKRGDLDGMSFSFVARKDQWTDGEDMPLREVIEADIFEVSFVTEPAYPQTEAAVRSLKEWRQSRSGLLRVERELLLATAESI